MTHMETCNSIKIRWKIMSCQFRPLPFEDFININYTLSFVVPFGGHPTQKIWKEKQLCGLWIHCCPYGGDEWRREGSLPNKELVGWDPSISQSCSLVQRPQHVGKKGLIASPSLSNLPWSLESKHVMANSEWRLQGCMWLIFQGSYKYIR